MSSRLWHEVDSYITDTLVQPDAALQAALAASDAAGLPQISVSPAHGKLLWLLARILGAKRILEIGTLGGYSTIWLARGLAAGGRLITLEPLVKEGPFDLTFIDADKQNNAEYFGWALKLSRPGSLIVVDNVVREGAVVDTRSRDAAVLGVRRLNQLMAAEPRVAATAIQTVGSKGYDGFAIAL